MVQGPIYSINMSAAPHARSARASSGTRFRSIDRALEDLTFIRDTMARAGTVTSVPGWGGVAMGSPPSSRAAIASRQGSRAEWLAVWLAEAVLALGIGGVAMVRKAEAAEPRSSPGLGSSSSDLRPAGLAGAVLTPVFYQAGLTERLPGLWMLMYGAGVTVAGATSVRVVPLLGMSFMALGCRRSWFPHPAGNSSHGAELRRPSDRLWTPDREEIRWVNAPRHATSGRRRPLPLAGLSAIKGGAAPKASLELDRLIHERVRLAIVSALAVNESLTFNELKHLLGTTDGNLSVHARRLEEAELCRVPQVVRGPNAQNRVPADQNRAGRAGTYLSHMEGLIRSTRAGS